MAKINRHRANKGDPSGVRRTLQQSLLSIGDAAGVRGRVEAQAILGTTHVRQLRN